MAQQIKKKFLSPEVINYFDDQINSVESSVSSEQSRAEGQEAAIRSEFAAADSAISGVVQGNFDLQQSDIDGLRSDVDALTTDLASEESARQSGDSALDARITTLEGQVGEDLQAAISALESDIVTEEAARVAADLVLDGKIETEKARIDAILSASTADKDSFAEIVSLINSVDTENDTAFAGYVTSNNAALAQEVSDRQSGDASTLSSANSYTDAQIAAIPSVDLSGYYTKTEVDAKEAALESSIEDLDVYAQDIRGDVDGHETRLVALEAQTDGPSFDNEKKVVGAELGFVELSRTAIKIMSCAVGRMAVHEGEDFTVSVVAGKTRLTWINSLANPSGEEKIEEGDNVFVVYAY